MQVRTRIEVSDLLFADFLPPTRRDVVLERGAIDADDDVTLLQPRLLGYTPRLDLKSNVETQWCSFMINGLSV